MVARPCEWTSCRRTVQLKMVKMVHFMLYIFYHSFSKRMRRHLHVTFVSFRIRIYSCFTNEKSEQMVKGVGEKCVEEQSLTKETEQEGPKRLVENLELQSGS